VLVRALGAGGPDVEADPAPRTARPGSDGPHAVVERAALENTLNAGHDPEQTVRKLVGPAHAAGAPDNIACGRRRSRRRLKPAPRFRGART
jgi:PPM family protein phosphatase